MSSAYFAAVIIPHFNDVARLTRCLEALWPQITSDIELVVVDNGSSQDLAPVLERWPDLRLLREALPGAACARNRGVAETTAPRLFFIDCDCLPAPDWLATARQVCVLSDVIGGRVEVFHEGKPPLNGAQAFEAAFAFDNQAYVERKGFSVTANLLTRRDVFERVGPFIPGLSEDLDWCHRARALGYNLRYEGDLRVGHPSRGDWRALIKKWRRLTEEGFEVNGRSLKRRVLWAIKGVAMPLSAVLHMPKMLRTKGLPLSARLSGGLTLARLRLQRMLWMLRQSLTCRI